MRAKTMIITGGTAGIGLAAARDIDKRGYRLILVGRDAARGQAALGSLSRKDHRFIAADLSLLGGVRALISELEATETAVDILANNAGTWFRSRELTVDGIERTVALNHIAYVALSIGLKPLLRAAGQARVINTGSFVYRSARYDAADLEFERRFSTNASYAATKLYNLMTTRALSKRWAHDWITVNCFSPGFVATDFGRGEGGVLEPFYRFTRLFAASAERGAATLVHLSCAADEASVSGGYFENCMQKPAAGAALDEQLCDQLLDWSARRAGFDPAQI